LDIFNNLKTIANPFIFVKSVSQGLYHIAANLGPDENENIDSDSFIATQTFIFHLLRGSFHFGKTFFSAFSGSVLSAIMNIQ
jgi:hypothetical protein